jgi:hypothetical protein
MPNPKDFKDKSSFMHKCISTAVEEGKPQDQAVAMCYSMWERKNEDMWVDMTNMFLED